MIRTQEKEHLLQLYANRKAFHGEMHDHANSGGTSDGKCTLEQWREQMQQLHMDFAAILDHRQVRHMYLPAWEDGLFIPGTEPGTVIPDSQASRQDMHYLILLPHRDELEKLLLTYEARDLAMREENGRWRLTPKGFMVSNSIILQLLEAQQQSKPLSKVLR